MCRIFQSSFNFAFRELRMKLIALTLLISVSPDVEIQHVDCGSGGTGDPETNYAESSSG